MTQIRSLLKELRSTAKVAHCIQFNSLVVQLHNLGYNRLRISGSLVAKEHVL